MTTIKRYITSNSTNSESGSNTYPKGSMSNPYTVAEYEAIPEEEWKGGHVEGMGYVPRWTEVIGSYPSSAFSDNYSDWLSDWNWGEYSHPFSHMGSAPEPGGGGGNGGEGTTGGNGGQDGSGNNGGNNGGTSNPYPQTTKNYTKNVPSYNLTEGMGIRASFSYNYAVSISGYKMTIGAVVLPSNYEGRVFWGCVTVKVAGQKEKSYVLKYNPSGYITTRGYIVIGDCTIDLPTSGSVKVTLRIGFNYDSGVGHTSNSDSQVIYPFPK